MKTSDQPKAKKFEKVEPGLFRYVASRVYYAVRKIDGKVKWENLLERLNVSLGVGGKTVDS